jgi:hypothetical protein
MFKKLKITCDEATAICDKNQYGEATFYEKIKLNIHFIWCRVCILYTKQNMSLTKLYKKHSQSCKAVKHCLTPEEKETIKRNIENTKA